MKKFTKKLLVCLMAVVLGIMPGIVTDVKAESYQWVFNGNYASLEEAGTYSIINSDQATVAVDGSITLNGEGSEYDKEGAVYEWTASNENIKMDVSSDQRSAKITGVTKGNVKVTLKITYKDENAEEPVDGIILKAVVKCTDPKITRDIAVLKKGQSVSFVLKGTSGYTPVTYSIKNKKYATVSKSGKVKAKKYGKTTLTVQADNQTWQLNVYISKSNIYKTISKAYTIEEAKTKYSQPRRMQKGYADCSSYVWKSYKTAGIYFGDKEDMRQQQRILQSGAVRSIDY